MTVTTTLHKLIMLPAEERRLLAQSALLLPAIHVALIVVGYSRLRAILEKLAPLQPGNEPVTPADVLPRAQQLARLVSTASQHSFYQATCLRRSMLLWWLLRRHGMESRVCFGVRRIDGMLQAHAWVEYDDVVINDSVNVREQFYPLEDALPRTRRGL